MQMNEKGAGVVEPTDKIVKIVLSGASGTLGAALRQRFATDRVPVVQLMRGEAVGNGQVAWDPAREPAIQGVLALEGCAAAVHLAGANIAARRWTKTYRRELWASRVDSTHALATALASLQKPPRTLIVASAVGIYGDRGDEVLDEGSQPGKGFLADLCSAWEAAAGPARQAGIRVVHARFGVVLGNGPGALAKMLPVFRMGLGGRLGSGRQWMSWMSLEDVVAAILFVLKTPALAGPVNLTSPNAITNAEFTRALGKALHRPAFLPAPAFALRLALGQMADEALLASTHAVPARLAEGGFRFSHATVESALVAALK